MITISTFELLSVLHNLISSGCYTVDISLARDHSSVTFTGTDGNGKDHRFEPILDQFLPGAPHSYKITEEALAPYIPTFGELVLISHAYKNAIENCATSLNSSDLSAELENEISTSLKAFKENNSQLDAFLSHFLGPVPDEK